MPVELTGERVPRLVNTRMVAPPALRLLSLTSLAWTVIVEVELPFAIS